MRMGVLSRRFFRSDGGSSILGNYTGKRVLSLTLACICPVTKYIVERASLDQ